MDARDDFAAPEGNFTIRTNQTIEFAEGQINLGVLEFLQKEKIIEVTISSRVLTERLSDISIEPGPFEGILVFNVKNIISETVRVLKIGGNSHFFIRRNRSEKIRQDEVDQDDLVRLEDEGKVTVRTTVT